MLNRLLFPIAAMAFAYWLKNRKSSAASMNAETMGKPIMTGVFADWCGHCHRALPEFTKLLNENNVNGVPVGFRTLNADGDKAAVQALGVQSYPTYILEKPNGEKQIYSGERDAASIKQFVASNV